MNTETENHNKHPELPVLGQASTRRTALKATGAALGMAAFGVAISPLASIPRNVSIDEFLQRHYKELTDEDKKKTKTKTLLRPKRPMDADSLWLRVNYAKVMEGYESKRARIVL